MKLKERNSHSGTTHGILGSSALASAAKKLFERHDRVLNGGRLDVGTYYSEYQEDLRTGFTEYGKLYEIATRRKTPEEEKRAAIKGMAKEFSKILLLVDKYNAERKTALKGATSSQS